jgi:glycosyltransferase involved in cell wall biosynthesis
MTGKPRVRIGCGYAVHFNISHGQKNVQLISRFTNPLQRIHRQLVAISVNEPGYDLIHTFNAIPLLTSCPYIVTFESGLPRLTSTELDRLFLRPLTTRLLKPQCRTIIAISKYAVRQMRIQHSDSTECGALLRKLEVVYPGVNNLALCSKPRQGETLKLLFCGNDFFRKGGPALVAAHDRLTKDGSKIETTVVSNLSWSIDDNVAPVDTAYVESEFKKLSQEGITHRKNITNSEVRDLMRSSDYLVLPTLHDTFGYVTLEAMASGTPVIATDTCVMPEIIDHEQSGFLLPFENDTQAHKWVHISEKFAKAKIEAYRSAINDLTTSLTTTLRGPANVRTEYEAMSARALNTVESQFGREVARQKLETIYAAALHI